LSFHVVPHKLLRFQRKPRRPRKEGEDAPATEAAEGDEGEKAKKIKAKRAPRPPRVPRPEGEAPPGEPSKNMLFVANLAFEVDDEGLSAIFTGVGIKVISARVVRRRFGAPVRRSKGFGFVDVGDEAEQKRAIELTQGKEVHGRQIAVKIAVNATKEGEEENGQTEAAEATAA
jgi:RNA recognition motif-containing protein